MPWLTRYEHTWTWLSAGIRPGEYDRGISGAHRVDQRKCGVRVGQNRLAGLKLNAIPGHFRGICPSECPFCLEPPRGFEPRTYALRVRCSTPELRRPFGPAPTSRPLRPRDEHVFAGKAHR